jgi:hypothetical protein
MDGGIGQTRCKILHRSSTLSPSLHPLSFDPQSGQRTVPAQQPPPHSSVWARPLLAPSLLSRSCEPTKLGQEGGDQASRSACAIPAPRPTCRRRHRLRPCRQPKTSTTATTQDPLDAIPTQVHAPRTLPPPFSDPPPPFWTTATDLRPLLVRSRSAPTLLGLASLSVFSSSRKKTSYYFDAQFIGPAHAWSAQVCSDRPVSFF